MGAPMATYLANAGHRTPSPIWGLGQQLWRMADHAAGPGASVSELVRWVEKQTGTELTPGAAPRQR